MKKHTLIILTLLGSVGLTRAQQARPMAPANPTLRIESGTYVVGGNNMRLVMGNHSFINNGTFADSSGAIVIAGTVNQSGTGTTIVKDITINSGATLNITAAIKTLGSINNSGTFSPTAATIEYGANANQNITAATYGTLKVSGSGNKTLVGNVNINTNLDLGSTTKIITGTNLITLKGTTATITGGTFGTAANSWIVTGNGGTGASNTGLGGLVIENIGSTGRTTAVTFPVGPTAALYNPVQVTNIGTTDNFTVAVNDQPLPGATTATTINNTWLISEAVSGGSDATIAAQWTAAQENGSFTRSFSRIAHSDGTALDYGGTSGAASGSGPYTQSGTGFTSFSPFGVINGGTVLPVRLIGFSLQQQQGKIMLQWQTSQEINTKAYIIQHSTDGVNYTNIGTQTAKPYNNGNNYYSFTDVDPSAKYNFYRLQINDKDGKTIYSNILRYDVSTSYAFAVKTNPVTNGMLQLHTNKKAAFTLQSVDGKVLYQSNLPAGIYNIDVSRYNKGIYFIRSGNQTERVVIQ